MNRKTITLKEVLPVIDRDVLQIIGPNDRTLTHAAPISEAQDEYALTFCNKVGAEAAQLILATRAGMVICREGDFIDECADCGKTLVVVNDPRLSFLRLVNAIFARPKPRGIHPTAVVSSEAKVHPNVYIGPFSYIGKCDIGEGTVIHGHVHIYDAQVRIGSNVVIHAGTVIGVDGFGYARNENQELEFFPSIGGVLIEDNVEIHSNVNVDRGTLGDTIIRRGSKIDKYCHIGHNVEIGRHSVITAKNMLGGSAKIGDYVWMAPCCCVRDGGINIGSHAFIGMASVITKDVPSGAKVVGSPARPLDEYKQMLGALKSLYSPA